MSSSKLDQIVKGAPPPGTAAALIPSTSPNPAAIFPAQVSASVAATPPPDSPSDSPSSSPPHIYLNLLILEASLRSQYLTLRDRRRQNVFFIFLLSAWVAGFTYLLFLRPREDGSGIGGSVYWVVETSEKVALLGGIVTAILTWGTGQWDRGVRWPRRWLNVANRGLRNINAKIVVIKGPWWKELLGYFVFLFPYSALFPPSGEPYVYTTNATSRQRPGDEPEQSREEDLSPGGDQIKLLLLPKPFSPDFRENWEIYRLDYWEKENERRSRLRQILRKREAELARKEGGWLWWAPWNGRRKTYKQLMPINNEKHQHKQYTEKDRQRRTSSVRSESHSRNASRSSTPSVLDNEEFSSMGTRRVRRGSSSGQTTEKRRKPKSSASFELNSTNRISPISRPA